MSPSSSPTRVRTWPASLAAASALSQTKNTASPLARPAAWRSAASLSGSRNLAIGPLASPSARATHPRPGAPRLWAKLTIWSKKLRGRPTAPGAGTARTTAPQAGGPQAGGEAPHRAEEAAGPAARPGGGEGAPPPPRLDRPGEHLEAGSPERVGDVGDHDRVPQVRLVGAVAQHGVAEGDP